MSATTNPKTALQGPIRGIPQGKNTQADRLQRVLDASAVTLAREIARDMLPLERILTNHGFEGPNDPEWVFLREHPDFLNLLAQCVQEWNSADSTQKRVEIKAQTALEELIPVLAVRAVEHGTSATAAAELTKVLLSLSGMRAGGGTGNTGPAFSITINMGNQQVVVRDVTETGGESIRRTIEHEEPGTGTGAGESEWDTDSVPQPRIGRKPAPGL
jgi:hypothetical protein